MESQPKNNNSQNSIPVRLDVLKDGKVQYSGEFVKDKIVLGRVLSADLRIDDPRVSRIHALIETKADLVVITDLASSHGTFVNGKKVVEAKLNFGDTLRLGFVEVKFEKGSGKTNPADLPSSDFSSESDATLVEVDRGMIDKMDRRGIDRRQKNAFPEEKRLDERRQGDRRIDQRVADRRSEEQAGPVDERRTGQERRVPLEGERRVGDRRRGDRRAFDITSLERRIEDRRTRTSDDDILPEELEKAFDAPDHARELELTVLWGDHILDVSNFSEESEITVGESPRNDYIIPSQGIPDEFPLVSIHEDGGAQLAFTDKMTGTIRSRDKIFSLSELKEEKFVKRSGTSYSLKLQQDDFAKLAIGNVNFFMLYVQPAPRIKPPPFMEKDPLLIRTTVGSVLVFLLLLIGLSFVPKPVPVTIDQIPERFQKIVIRKRPVLPSSKDGLIAKGEEAKQGGSVAGQGGPFIGPEGEAGRKDLPRKEEKAQLILPQSKPKEVAPPQINTPKPDAKSSQKSQKVVDADRAKKVGLLKAFSQGAASKEAQNLLGGAGVGPEGPGGFDEFGKAISGARGKTLEETGGAGGKGLKGVEAGGGGKTVGIDGPSTGGLGRGYYGTGIGEGISGPGRFGQKGEHAISIVSENVQVLSGLSKDIINAVVARHRSEIRACYESALQRNPNLRGKVVMAFTIQANGIVSSAIPKESTIGDAGLEGCITSKIKTWVFPKPDAPAVTEVSAYPFYLNPGGG
ncbi:MAG: FHA domain-containing protein [Proteobacteria bacterium]|nr:FHA domain-containing protein [Pseudomonadota bacterium]